LPDTAALVVGCIGKIAPTITDALETSHLPFTVGLPDLMGVNIQRRQPAPAAAEGVNALHVSQVQDFPVLLRGVTDDHGLARFVRAGGHVHDRLPPQHHDGLLIHRQIGEIIGVHEDVRIRLVVIHAAFEELKVFVRDEFQVTTLAVGVEASCVPQITPSSAPGRPIDRAWPTDRPGRPIDRYDPTTEIWRTRLEKLRTSRLLGRLLVASCARPREAACRLGVRHLANLSGSLAP
jgi:hypothetical protein